MCVCGFSTLSSPGRHLISTTAAAAVAHSGVDPQQSARCDGAREMPLFHRLHDRIGIRIYSLFCFLFLHISKCRPSAICLHRALLYCTVRYNIVHCCCLNTRSFLMTHADRERESERAMIALLLLQREITKLGTIENGLERKRHSLSVT